MQSDIAREGASGGTLLAPSPLRWLFVAAILAGSFLLFLVQPMVARMALPRLGGAPAVWNSAMLVYQALLLGGYAYAHWLGRLPVRTQGAVHLGVLALASLWLPIGLIGSELSADIEPALWVPWLLSASIGPLFLAVAAQAPLIQRWYSAASGGRDPYMLYAASNIGSFGGLIAYPLLVEPQLALDQQSGLWTAGFVVMLLLIAACALLLPRAQAGTVESARSSDPPEWRRVVHWIVLAFVPSGLMLATTTFLTTDIVAVPLLWVLPLGLYLLSFSIAFARGRFVAYLMMRLAPVALLLFGATLMAGDQQHAFLNAGIGLALLFIVATALHARMYELRPEPDRLTGFYLAMSVGGALGGVFAAVIAPVVFDWTYEYPLLILAAGLLAPQAFLLPALERYWLGRPEMVRAKLLSAALLVALCVWAGLADPLGLGERSINIAFLGVALIGLFALGMRTGFVVALLGALILFGGFRAIQLSLTDARTRSYFGVYTVTDYGSERRLAHGTTLHGVQLGGGTSTLPTTYYVADSGVGRAMLALDDLYGDDARVGVVGLGTGTLACYARPGQRWRFFEIDPAMVRIARDSGKFTFLSQCLPQPRIALGDARLRLAEMPDDSLDLLVLDAFSSDAVPMHLMTAEAFATYARVLSDDGLLMVHISNRFLALAPVVSNAARIGGWHDARMVFYPDAAQLAQEATVSDWIALSRDPRTIATLTQRGGDWTQLKRYPGFTPWTDDYASIVPLLRALHPELRDD